MSQEGGVAIAADSQFPDDFGATPARIEGRGPSRPALQFRLRARRVAVTFVLLFAVGVAGVSAQDSTVRVANIYFTETFQVPQHQLLYLMPLRVGQSLDETHLDRVTARLKSWLKATGHYLFVDVYYSVNKNKSVDFYVSLAPMPLFDEFALPHGGGGMLFKGVPTKRFEIGPALGVPPSSEETLGGAARLSLFPVSFASTFGYQRWPLLGNALGANVTGTLSLPRDLSLGVGWRYARFLAQGSTPAGLSSVSQFIRLDKLYLASSDWVGLSLGANAAEQTASNGYLLWELDGTLKVSPFRWLSLLEHSRFLVSERCTYPDIVRAYLPWRDGLSARHWPANASIFVAQQNLLVSNFLAFHLFGLFPLSFSFSPFVDLVAVQDRSLPGAQATPLLYAGAVVSFSMFGFAYQFSAAYGFDSRSFSFDFSMSVND